MNPVIEIEEDDPDAKQLGNGTLAFSEGNVGGSGAGAHIKSWSQVVWYPQTPSPIKNGTGDVDDKVMGLKFEIVSARTVADSKEKKHVAYTVMVRRYPYPDVNPAVIERRYTDFLRLYDFLRKDYPDIMCHVTFPKKVLLGNFRPEVITERSDAFENLLHFVSNHEKLRYTQIFTSFLHAQEHKEAENWMRQSRFEEALPLFENIFYLLNKLYTDRHPEVMTALCEVIACHFAVDGFSEAEKFAEMALQRFETVSDADILEFYVPLLHLCVRLWWSLGKDKRSLETRLKELKQKGIRVEGCPNLLDAIRDKYSQ